MFRWWWSVEFVLISNVRWIMVDENIKCPACGNEIENLDAGCNRCGQLKEHIRDGVFLPGPRGPVNDFAFLLSQEQFDDLTEKLEMHFEETDIPIVVATVYSSEPLEPSDYANLLYNWWGIGKKKVNKGVLILIVTSRHWVESEVGTGLEKFIGEKETDEALRLKAGPFFKDGKFYEGIIATFEHLNQVIKGI